MRVSAAGIEQSHMDDFKEVAGGRDSAEADVVCGTIDQNFILIPRSEALRLARIYYAIETSVTWGEFKAKLSEGEWDDLLKWVWAESLTLEEFCEQEGFASIEDAVESYKRLPLCDRRPFDSERFESDILPLSDGDWPSWPEQDALKWVPREIQQRFGRTAPSLLNGPSLVLDASKESEIVAAMKEHGYMCTADSMLIQLAKGSGDIPTLKLWAETQPKEQKSADLRVLLAAIAKMKEEMR